MQSFQDGQNIAAAPFAIGGALATGSVLYGASPLISGTLNLTGAYEGVKNLFGENGVKKTINKYSNGDLWEGTKSLGGDILNASLTLPILSKLKSFGSLSNTNKLVSDINEQVYRLKSGNLVDINTTHKIRNPRGLAKQFSGEELMQQGQARMRKVFNDAEYRESLQRELGLTKEQANNFVGKLNSNMSTQVYDETLKLSPTMMGANKVISVPLKLSLSNGQVINARAFGNSGANLYKKLGKIFPSGARTQKMSFGEGNKELLNTPNLNRGAQESLRQTASHEAAHASEFGSVGQYDVDLQSVSRKIHNHNAKFPVRVSEQLKGTPSETYYNTPTELRARALQLRREHQVSGKSYKDLLNDEELINSNSNFRDLKKAYNQEDLLNYLDHFAYNNETSNNSIQSLYG